MARKTGIGRAEMDILRFIGNHHPATVRQVADYLAEAKGQTRTTALNVMERLREKGHLAREKGEDGVYRYLPSVPKAQLMESLVRDFVNEALGGSLQPFVAYLAQTPKQISDAEIDTLKRLVQTLEAQKAESTESKEEQQ